jgi:hypothetical protein
VDPIDPTETDDIGGLSAAQMSGFNAARTREQELRLKQQEFYDRMARQIEERRAGPSTSERLFQLSAALARPTSVRGFSGVMNNVMPVLQEQAKAAREGEEGRAEALNALQMAQMQGAQTLAAQDTANALTMAKITAAAGKRRTALDTFGRLRDLTTGAVIGTDAPLPPPAIGEVRDGYEYLGGDPKLPASYRKVR